MSRRVSQRAKRPSAIQKEARQQPPAKKRKNKESANPFEIDDLVDKVANAVLEKLKKETSLNLSSNADGNDLVNDRLSDAPACVQVSGAGVSGNNSGQFEIIDPIIDDTLPDNNNMDQVGTATSVQGSIAAVVASMSDGTTSKPQSIFVPSDMPIDMAVSDKLKGKIWANEYIDFSLLLTKKKDQQSFNLCISKDAMLNGQHSITLETNQKVKYITNIENWITAFQTYVGVYTQKYPTDAPNLMKYSEIIRDLSLRGHNWKYYDENFRFMRQKSPSKFPWGSVHWELWMRSQPIRGPHGIITNKLSKNDGEKVRSTNVPRGYCYRIHRGLQCAGCNYKHNCPKCDKNHSMKNCNFRGFEKSIRNNTFSGVPANTSKNK